MIWQHWPVPRLQSEIGDDLLSKIGEILPLVDQQGASIFFETDRLSLVKLLAAFAPEDYFNKSSNLKECINFLPPKNFLKLRKALGLAATQLNNGSKEETAQEILASTPSFTNFLELFEIPERFWPTKAETKPGHFVSRKPSISQPIEITTPYKVLKDFQSDIFYRTMEKFSPPMSRMILQMPTGSGKTRTTMEVIANHLNSEISEYRRVVWLANSRELCEQAIACFNDVWQHVALVDVDVQRIWGQYEKPKERIYTQNSQFLVGSLQTLWKLVKSKDSDFREVFRKTTLLVVDEAHISVADTYARVVRDIVKLSKCRVIGLTATPGRTIEEETGELSDLFHNEIVSLRDPSGSWPNTIAYLRSEGVLSSVVYEPLTVETNTSLSEKDIAKLGATFDYPIYLLKEIGQSMVRSAEIIIHLEPHLKSSSKILLFAPSVENSKFLTSMLTFLGYGAAHIDGDTADQSRARFIDDFVKGDLQVLCNYGVLAAGFDAPKTDVLCVARPTKSPVLYSQMIGRGLRGPAVGGTKSCTIIEVKDNFLNQGTQDQLYDYFNQYWES